MRKFDADHIHFVGIGGYGMSGLAKVLHQRGFRVSGCDATDSPRTRYLASVGIPVSIGHDPSHLDSVDTVVYSTDVPGDNIELEAARESGRTVLHRSDVLGWFLNEGHGIAISGTHGKTTTTALAGLTLAEAGYDPTVFVGGEVPQLGGTARAGRGPWVVAEACESDGTLSRYRPRFSVISGIEPEHLDHHDGDIGALIRSFETLIEQTDSQGRVILCADDPVLLDLSSQVSPPARLYGLSREAQVRVVNPRLLPGETRWELLVEGRSHGEFSSPLPGLHNAVNSAAVAALLLELGGDLESLRRVLESFRGVKRRFQALPSAGGVQIVSDYAHHPTEIKATIQAAQQYRPERIIAVFQPQRFSRTRDLWEQFAEAFGEADVAVLTEIYSPVGEEPLEGVTGEALAREVLRHRSGPTVFMPSLDEVRDHLLGEIRSGDLVLVMGAGDVWRLAENLSKALTGSEPQRKAQG